MPWAKYASVTATAPNPSCTKTIRLLRLYDNDIKGCRFHVNVASDAPKTVRLLRLYDNDIKGCKFHVNVASDAPENIPGSQWEQIFKDEPVDLDQVLSSLHRITLDEQRKTRLGGATISILARLNHLGRFPLWQNGLLLGAALRGPSRSPSHTVPASLMTTETTSRVNSPRSTPLLTNASYGTTRPSGMSSMEGSPHYSWTPSVSSTSTPRSSFLTVCSMAEEQEKCHDPLDGATYAAASTTLHARVAHRADTSMPVCCATSLATARKTVPRPKIEATGLHPRYLRYNIWHYNTSLSATTTEWSEHAADESLTSLAMYFRNWHMFHEYMNNIPS